MHTKRLGPLEPHAYAHQNHMHKQPSPLGPLEPQKVFFARKKFFSRVFVGGGLTCICTPKVEPRAPPHCICMATAVGTTCPPCICTPKVEPRAPPHCICMAAPTPTVHMLVAERFLLICTSWTNAHCAYAGGQTDFFLRWSCVTLELASYKNKNQKTKNETKQNQKNGGQRLPPYTLLLYNRRLLTDVSSKSESRFPSFLCA